MIESVECNNSTRRPIQSPVDAIAQIWNTEIIVIRYTNHYFQPHLD